MTVRSGPGPKFYFKSVKNANNLYNYVTYQDKNWVNFTFSNLRINSKKNYMSLLTILVVLIVAGIVLYLINRYIPMDGKIKSILNIVVVIVIIVWLLKAFGIWGDLSSIKLK